MPYIKLEKRARFDSMPVAADAGELNYQISRAAHDYVLGKLEQRDLSYALLNETHGAMMAAAAEFYRTVLAPYEDNKRKENGDVSPLPSSSSEAVVYKRPGDNSPGRWKLAGDVVMTLGMNGWVWSSIYRNVEAFRKSIESGELVPS